MANTILRTGSSITNGARVEFRISWDVNNIVNITSADVQKALDLSTIWWIERRLGEMYKNIDQEEIPEGIVPECRTCMDSLRIELLTAQISE